MSGGGGTIVWTDVCWLAALALALAAVGAVLLWLGRRGRLVGDHPHCRACGYDLSGLGEGTRRCPECGGDLAPAKAIVVGRRTPRPACLLAGGLLLLFALATAVQDARMSVRAWEVEANRPVWWLRRQLRADARPAERDRAYAELSRRLGMKELWPSQARAVARGLIDLQGDPGVTWDRRWARFVCEARSTADLGDADWRDFGANSVSMTARCRPRVTPGDELPFECDFSLRVHRTTEFYFGYELARVEVGGVPVDVSALKSDKGGRGGGWSRHFERFGPERYRLSPAMLARAGIKPGPQTLKLVFAVEVHAGPSWDDTAAARAVLVRKTETRALQWTLLPPDVPSVELVRSAELDARVRAAVGPADVRCVPDEDGSARFECDVGWKPVGISTSMTVYARDGTREWLLGRTPNFFRLSGTIPTFAAARVDLVLRPDVDSPRRTIDVMRIWGGELEFRDLPVRWFNRNWQPIPPPKARPAP